ncbi:MAG: transglycosylase domain-containing protein, partial [Thermoleophilum sp.]|nr:transglycosylase domain-containing protein [Thermoleophilum sp.]
LLRPYATPDGRWRLPATVQDVDPRYLDLLIAYEDKRFRRHHGVDPLAVVRAAMQLITHGRIVSGGSTITMQVARLLEPRGERAADVATGAGDEDAPAAHVPGVRWRRSRRAVALAFAPTSMPASFKARSIAARRRSMRSSAEASLRTSSRVAGSSAPIKPETVRRPREIRCSALRTNSSTMPTSSSTAPWARSRVRSAEPRVRCRVCSTASLTASDISRGLLPRATA